eukprot:GEMP01006939.1.p1 GENE.GEMP01006939.1~~GEMP01006939.1.p1  ORF type:complete len:725 (+),score=156.73 GEMP01006939.1:382-2556(+)
MGIFRAFTLCAVAPQFVLGQIVAQTSCPCLVAQPASAPSSLSMTYVNDAGATVTHTFPNNYGIGACAAWDNGEAPQCLQADRPAWCTAAWCYVDADCIGHQTSWDVEQDGGVPDAWFPNSGLHRSYATCGTPTYLAHQSKIDLNSLTADGLITLVDNYLISIRDAAEATQAQINTDTLSAMSRHCDAPLDNCNCASCNATTWNATEVDFTRVGFSTQDMSSWNAFEQSAACVVRGQLEGHFQAIGQQVYDDTRRIGEIQYTWANTYTGMTMVYPAQQSCPTKRDFRFDSEFVLASTGPKDMMVVLASSEAMKGANWDRALGMMRRLFDTLTEYDFISLVMYGRFSSDVDAVSYEPTDAGLADGLSPGKIARRVTQQVKDDIMRWIAIHRPDNQSPRGRESWHDGLVEAGEIMKASRAARATSYCQAPILFFTPDLDQTKMESYYFKEIFDDFQPQPVLILYSMYEANELDAEDWSNERGTVPRDLACAFNGDDKPTGIFVPFQSSHDMSDYFVRYSTFLAAATENRNNIRYSRRTHKTSGAEVLTACLPAYEKRRHLDRELSGVVCVDVDLIVPLEALKNNASATFDYKDFTTKTVIKSAQCESFRWSESVITSWELQCTTQLPSWMWIVVWVVSNMSVFCCLFVCYKKRKQIVIAVRTSQSARMLSSLGSRALGSRSVGGSRSLGTGSDYVSGSRESAPAKKSTELSNENRQEKTDQSSPGLV